MLDYSAVTRRPFTGPHMKQSEVIHPLLAGDPRVEHDPIDRVHLLIDEKESERESFHMPLILQIDTSTLAIWRTD